MPTRPTASAPPFVVAVAGWIVPGSGYLLIGQRARGLTVMITLLLLFVMGLWIGGVRVVEPSPEMSLVSLVRDRPWFMGQVLFGPLNLLPIWLARAWEAHPSHARVMEIGTLYTAIAGMLNLLVIIDSAFRARRGEGKS